MASYKNFDGIIWNYHSVQLPAKMAKEHAEELVILDYDAFFWPLWNSNGMQTTIDSAGRIVIPKTLRDRLGLIPGGESTTRLRSHHFPKQT